MSFIPTDFTDVGQGTVLYEAYHHKLRYCEGVGWIAYNGGVWEPSETAAHSYSQRLTDLQMQEAKTMGLNNIGMFGQPASMSQTYMEYAVMRRSSAKNCGCAERGQAEAQYPGCDAGWRSAHFEWWQRFSDLSLSQFI